MMGDGSSLWDSPNWVGRGCWGSRVSDGRWFGAQQWWVGLRSVCTNLAFLLDVGMYVPSKIFQASQQSVKLLSSPVQQDVDGKVSPVPLGLSE